MYSLVQLCVAVCSVWTFPHCWLTQFNISHRKHVCVMPQADVALSCVVNCPQGWAPPSSLDNSLLMASHAALTMSNVVKCSSSHLASVLEKQPSSCVLPQGQGSKGETKQKRDIKGLQGPLFPSHNVHVACEAVRVGLKLTTGGHTHSDQPPFPRTQGSRSQPPSALPPEGPGAGRVPMAGEAPCRLRPSAGSCPGRTCPHSREGLSRAAVPGRER